MLTVGSLFAGIGGFDLGLERTGGFRTAWFCEQDEFCQHILAEHWPGVPCYPDITRLRGSDVEPVDVLCGGFPCQDISVAGRGEGIGGARSGLWSEYARLIGELRPRYVLVENVAALLARGLGTVVGDLSALGYDAEWDCIPASAVGAPHRRDRVWLVAYPNGEGEPIISVDARPRRGLVVPLADADGTGSQGHGGQRGLRQDRGAQQSRGNGAGSGVVADASPVGRQQSGPPRAGRPGSPDGRRGVGDVGDTDGLAGSSSVAGDGGCCEVHGPGQVERTVGSGGAPGDKWRVEPDVGVLADGVPAGLAGWWDMEPDIGRTAVGVVNRVQKLRSLGNALVPQIAEWLGMRIMQWEAENARTAA